VVHFALALSFRLFCALTFGLLLAEIAPSHLHAQTRCDTLQTCLGNVLTITQSGQAQYVDIQQTPAQRSLSTALSFEAWINPQRIPNTRQFIAGLWGPNTDANDVWVLYISQQDELVFEINGATTSLGSADNTIARTPFAARYGSWTHVAAVFDGASQTATLFVNGMQVAQNRNAASPANRLRTLQTPSLLMQIGSTNALGNLGEQNATFRGQMDEIRLWSRALTQSEILCGLYSALRGNESNLTMYFRCNDVTASTRLCDASPNNTIADMRSGARCQAPSQNRTIPPFFTIQPQIINDAFQCDQTRTYQIRIRSIAAGCSERVALSLSGAQAGEFRITPERFTLAVGAETVATLTLNTQLTGALEATLNLARENLCGDTLRTALNLTRTTTLQPSQPSVTFGTLYAGCREVPFAERTLTLRNAGTQPLQLLGFRQSRAQMFRVLTGNLQQTLAAGASVQVTMRFFPADTANTYFDTLRIRTGDVCQPELALPLAGTIEEAVIIRRGFGLARLDSVTFGRECPQSGITDPFEFTWESAVRGADVRIDTVIAPPFMRVRSLRYPVLLRSGAFAEPNFLRFAPLQPGLVRDSVIIRASVPSGLPGGTSCTFEKKIIVSGRGNAVEVRITPSAVNFGNVIVGQQGTSTARLSNPSTEDTLRILVFLRRGDNFFLTGGRTFTLAPGASVNVPLTFRPSADSTYTDDLCISEQRCFFTTCATLTGRGVQTTFRFDSVLTRIDGVLGCATRLDTLTIFNTSGAAQTLTNISFSDQSGGRIEIISGLNNTNVISTVIPAGGSLLVQIRYSPNDLTQDRTDAAFITFRAAGQDWTLSIRATSVAPRLFITPLTAFGVVEIGDRRLDTIQVENISQVPVQLSTLTLPDGYTLHWSERLLPYTLQPREVVRFGVTFAPTEDRRYDGTVTANSLSPCPTMVTGRFQGRGARADLELGANPVNIGFTRPCECRTAITTLFNSSFANTYTVQSAVITASDNDPLFSRPQLFTWTSRFSPNGTVPYQIPPQGIDTITIRFCPRTIATAQNVLNAATMRITAQSPVKQQTFTIDLTGRRTLVFTPNPSVLNFTPTLVGTDAAPLTVNLSIPTGTSQNPSPQPVVIDSIGFLGADGLPTSAQAFRVISPQGAITVQPNQASVPIRIGFRPTEARPYAVRLVLYQSQPCRDTDTTVAINGIGFVGALGLPFRFNNAAIRLDTFRITTCGNLIVPIFSARNLSDSLNIRLRLAYDTTRIRAVSASSDVAAQNRVVMRSTSGGVELRLDGVRLDSLRALFRVDFVSLSQRRVAFPITIDSIDIRTSQGGAFALVPAGTFAQFIIQETRIEAPSTPQPQIQFDSVQVLGCATRTLVVRNTGDVAVRALSLVNLPPSVRILAAMPPLTDSVRAGQSLTLTLEYCPRSESRIDTTLGIRAENPCASVTQATIAGRGFRTDFPIVFSFTSASLRGTIGDTLTLPLLINRDMAVTLNNTRFWLRNFRFTVNLAYSPYSLQYIGASTTLRGASLAAQNTFPRNAPLRGALTLNFTNVDSLAAGTIALLRFVVAVPDTLITPMLVSADSATFRTDSLMFLRIRPISTMATWTTDGICNITFLRAPGAGSGGNLVTKTTTQIFSPYPNPATERITLEFEVAEARPIVLALYDFAGNAVQTLLSGQILAPGRYAVEADARALAQGVYWWRLQDGASVYARSVVIMR
jgi:hypothetical protein